MAKRILLMWLFVIGITLAVVFALSFDLINSIKTKLRGLKCQ